MFDAVGTAVQRGRTAVAHRRWKRRVRTKIENKWLGLNRQNGRRLLDRKGVLLDRGREKANGHRAAIELAGLNRDEIRIRIAIRREILKRAMIGRFLRRVHRLAIRDAGSPRTVQTDEHHHEQSQEPNL